MESAGIHDQLREILSPGAEVSSSTLWWLREGIQEHMETGDPLERCLGIHRAEYQIAMRDQYLVEAWQLVDESASPWGRCMALERELLRFETTVWRNHQHLDEPDSRWSQLRQALFWAFHHSRGIKMPATARRLQQIAKSTGGYISQPAPENPD